MSVSAQDSVYLGSSDFFELSRAFLDSALMFTHGSLIFLLLILVLFAGQGKVANATDATNGAVTPTDDSTVGATKIKSTESIKRVLYQHKLLGNVEYGSLREASGIAISTRSPDVMWSHNDSGYGPFLFAFSLTGKSKARFYLGEANASDWEDMASFYWRDQSWLMVADTGDNASQKTHYSLYLVPEPEIQDSPTRRTWSVEGVQRAKLVYPTGPADTEGVAVDAVEGRVYLLTKRQRPPQLFSLPLSVFDNADKLHTARFETQLYPLRASTLQEIVENPKYGLNRALPTAMDFAPDRSFAVVHTYGYSYRFNRTNEQSWAQALAATPEQIQVPAMQQSEAVAVGPDSQSLYYTSEGNNPPIYRLVPNSPPSTK